MALVHFTYANFSTRGNCNETQNNNIFKLIHAVCYVTMLVFGASFDGDRLSVKIFCNEFYQDVTAELNCYRTTDFVKYCDNCKGLLPCYDHQHLLKIVRTYLLAPNSVINHSDASVQCSVILNEATRELLQVLRIVRFSDWSILCR